MSCSFTPAQATAVCTAGHAIDRDGPRDLRIAAGMLALALRGVPLRERRTTALAAVEIALRDALAPVVPAPAPIIPIHARSAS